MGPNIPEEVRGFGKLGRFVRAILKYAISAHISSVTVENYPAGTTASPKATISPGPSGTAIKLKLSAGGGSAALRYPFKVADASNPTDGLQVSVLFGSVTEFVNSPVSPVGMEEDNDPLFFVACVSGNTVVYLDVTVNTDLGDPDYGEIQAVDIDAANSLPSQDYAGGHFYLTLANIFVDTDTIDVTQQAGGSMGFRVSGETGEFWSLGPAY